MNRYLSSIVIVVTFAIAMLVLTVALHADNTITINALNVQPEPPEPHPAIAPAQQEPKVGQPAHQVVCTPPSTAPTGMKPVYAQGSCTVTYYVPDIQQTVCTTRQVGTDLRGKPVFRTTCTQHQ